MLTRFALKRLLAGTCVVSMIAQPALGGSASLPVNGQVVAGTAAIGTNGNVLTVDQSSKTAVVNWEDFSVGSGMGVNFKMPTADSAILNRVTGGEASTIAGSLLGNGQVYLVNQNGIAITGSGSVKVGGGFVGSTLGIDDQDFIAGKRRFSGTSDGTISNSGTIEAGEGGFVGLISNSGVENDGLISVPAGKVGLGTGSAITLDPNGNGFLQIVADSTAPGGGKGIGVNGRIRAAGGRVEVRASSAGRTIRDLVNVGGEIDVSSVRQAGGTIVLDAGKGGVALSGNLKASSGKARGGSIFIGGNELKLRGASLDASGSTGGNIAIGGGWRGKALPEISAANAALLDEATKIDASGHESKGGEVTIWSNGNTQFLGLITATGAAGNGGNAEVSSHGTYNFNGRVNLLSTSGKAGNLLLDPYNLTISGAANTNQSGFAATGTGAVINVSSLTTALAGGNVTVWTGSSGAETGDITVSSAITWSANTTLTLSAAGSIFVNAAITQSSATGGLNLTAGGTSGIRATATLSASGGMVLTETNAAASGQITSTLSGSVITFNGPTAAYVSGIATPTLTVVGNYNGPTKIVIASGVMAFKPSTNPNFGQSSVSEYNIQTGAVMQVGDATLPQYIAWSTGAAPVVTGGGTFQKIGAAVFGINTGGGAGTSTFTWKMDPGALIDIQGGTFNNYSGQSFWVNNYADLNVASGATFAIANNTATFNKITGSGTISGSGSLTIGNNNGTSTFSGVISGATTLVKAGTGTITLGGLNTYTGSTSINSGTIAAASTTPLGSNSAVTIASGAVLDLGGKTFSIGSLSGAGTVTNSSATAATLTTGGLNTSTTFSGVMQNGTGNAALTKTGTGTFTLTGANTYSGATTINGGTLAFTQNQTFTQGVTVSAGATLSLTNASVGSASAGATTIAGTVSGYGSVNGYASGGTAILLTGNAVIAASGGSLTLNSNGVNGSAVSLALASAANITTSGTVVFNINASGSAGGRRGFGLLGNATINSTSGSLTVNISDAGNDVRIALYSNTLTLGGTQTWNLLTSGYQYNWNGGGGAGTFNITALANANLTFDAHGNTLLANLNGSTWTLGAGSTTSINGVVLNGTLTLLGTGTITSPLTLTGNSTIATTSATDTPTISGIISGSGFGLTKTGLGTLNLTAANTYTAATTVSAGTLALTNSSASNGFTVSSGAILQVGSASNYTFNTASSSITGTGTLRKVGTGTITFAGSGLPFVWNMGAGGLIDVQAGTMIGGNNSQNNWSANLSDLNVAAGATFNGVEASVRVDRITGSGSILSGWNSGYTGLTFGVNNGSSTFNGVLGNGAFAGNFIKSGTGTITLAGTNTYTGTTTVSAGTLQIGSAGTLGSGTYAGAISISSGATLQYSSSAAQTLSGVISGAGALTKDTSTTATLTLSGANTYSGATTLSAGTLKAGSASAFGSNSAVAMSSGTTLDIAGFSNSLGSLAGGGTVTNSNATAATLTTGGLNTSTTFSGVLQNGVGALALTKLGTGTFTLAGSNTYSGATTVSAGTLQAGSVNAFSSNSAMTVAASSILDLAGYSVSLGSLAGAGQVTNSSSTAGTLSVGALNTSTTFSGTIQNGTGSVALTKTGTGTLTLTGANTYTGRTTVSAGTLAFTQNQTFTQGVTVSAGSTLSLMNASVGSSASGNTIISGTVSGYGSVNGFAGAGSGLAGIAFSGSPTLAASGGSLAFNAYASGITSYGFTTAATATTVATSGAVILNASGSGTAGGRRDFQLLGDAMFNSTSGSLTVNVSESGGDVRFAVDGRSLTLGGTQSWNIQSAGSADVWMGGLSAFNLTALASANLTFNSGGFGASSNMSGWTWTLGAGSNVAISGVELAGTFTLNGTGTLTSGIALTGNSTINTASLADAPRISGIISGGFGLTKTGSGTLVLSGNNTYTGATTVNAGTLKAGSASAFGVDSALSANTGGTLDLAGFSVVLGSLAGTGGTVTNSSVTGSTLTVGALNTSTSFAGSIQDGAGTISLEKAGTGTLTLSGSNSYSGTTTVTAGTLKAGSITAIGSNSALTVAAGGVFDLGGFSVSAGSLDGAGTVTNSSVASAVLTLGGLNTLANFSGVLQDGAGKLGLTKIGTDVQYLSGTSTYSGATLISDGTLYAESTTAFSGNSDYTVDTNGTLNIGKYSNSIGSLSGTGIVTNERFAPVLTIGGTNTNATFAGTLLDGVWSGRFTLAKIGSGTQTLTGANNFTGTVSVYAGNLTVSGESWFNVARQIDIASGAVFELNNSDNNLTFATGSKITGSGTFRLSGNTVIAQPGADSGALLITMSGGLIDLQGTSRIGNGTYSPIDWGTAVAPNYASLNVGAGASFDVNNTGRIFIDGLSGTGTINLLGGTLNLGINNGSSTFDGSLVGSTSAAKFFKWGTGTFTLAGNLTLDANTSVSVLFGKFISTGNMNVGTHVLKVSVSSSGGTPSTFFATGAITAGELQVGGMSDISMTGANHIGLVDSTTTVGNLILNNSQSLVLGSLDVANKATIHAYGASSDLTIAAGGRVTVAGSGDALVLGAGRNFINNQGSNAVATANGRWLIYSKAPAGNVFGGLDSGNTAIWNTAWGTTPSQTGNRYIFADQLTLTVKSVSGTKTYGQDFTGLLGGTYTVEGYQGVANAYLDADLSAILHGTASVTSTGAGSAAHVGTYGLTVSQGTLTASSGYQLAFDSSATLTVNKAALTVTANGDVKTYDGNSYSGGNGVSYSGFVNGENASVLSGTISYGGAAQGAVHAGTYAIDASGLTSSDYDITFASGTLTVNKAALTITGNTTTGLTYNGTTRTNSFTTSTLYGTDSVNGVAGLASGTHAGTYTDNLSGATGSGLSDYTITFQNGSLKIDKAALTITGDTTTGLTYDGTTRTNGFTTSTLYGTDSVTGVAGLASGKHAGTYNDNLSGATGSGLSDYDITYQNGSLKIDKAALTITGDTTTGLTYNGTTRTNGFTTSTLYGTDSVTGVAGLASGKHAGTYNDNLSGATGSGLSDYIITYQNGSLTIDKAALTITGNTTTGLTYNGTTRTNTYAVTGLVTGDTVTGVSGLASNSHAGTYVDNLSGATGSNISDYAVTYQNGSLKIDKAALTITGNTTTGLTYNGTTRTNGFTTSTLYGTDSVTGVAGLASGKHAGTYNDNLSGATGSGLSDYIITYQNGSLAIDKAVLTITGKTTTGLTYNGTMRTNGFTTSTLYGTDTVTGVAGLASGTHAGTYTDNLSGATGSGLSDYTITYQNGSLKIGKTALTVTANGDVKTYDGQAYSGGNGVSYSGFVNGETASVLSGTITYGGSAQGAVQAGTYAIAASGLTSNDYAITFASGTLTVKPGVTPPPPPPPPPTSTEPEVHIPALLKVDLTYKLRLRLLEDDVSETEIVVPQNDNSPAGVAPGEGGAMGVKCSQTTRAHEQCKGELEAVSLAQ